MKKMLSSQKGEHLKCQGKDVRSTMALENHLEEGNQDGNDSADEVHLEGEHIKL